MATGDKDDFSVRNAALLPPSWFGDNSPILTAVLQGFSNVGAFAYGLISFAKLQTRISTATGFFLDLIAFDYFGRYIQRRVNEVDANFRARIKKELLRERVTRKGMIAALTDLTGHQPSVFEPWNTGDTGGYGVALGYSVHGAYGSALRPAEVDITAWRSGGGGVPGVASYHAGNAGYGAGQIEYSTAALSTGGMQDSEIINTVAITKPNGVKVNLSIIG